MDIDIIGYARVSTLDQKLHLQTDALELAGCARIFTDTLSGAKASRPGLEELKLFLRPGDTVVVWRLDRLGRTLKDLIGLVGWFSDQGVGFRSLTEGFDTTTTGGTLVFQIFGAMAEFERNVTIERTKAGLAAARARGRFGGRPPVLDEAQRALAVRMYHEKIYPLKDLCRMYKISKTTLYNYVDLAEAAKQDKK